MKKYFIHDGNSQTGPYSYDELQSIGIKPTTHIWFEGLDNWKFASEVEELKPLFKSTTPPPLNIPNPPPRPKENSTSVAQEAPKKKSKIFGRILTFIGIIIVLWIGLMIYNSNGNGIPGIKIEVNPPKPVVLKSKADKSKSGLFNARATVYATIQNQGGDGNVLVTFKVEQGGHTYTKSKSLTMSPMELQELEMTFEEVDFLSGKITYDVEAEAR